jgi:transglutaminase-like putative cysteine protease
VRRLVAAAASRELLDASEYLWESPYVPFLAELSAYAQPVFAPGLPIIEAVRALNRRIHNDFSYSPKSTSVETPLAEVLSKRRGVCQDFAHVMIGALRSVGIAARYVSGYIPSGQGAEASHAWASVFVPGIGWIDFDPTNDLMPEGNHIVLAWGRDFGDVTPIRGVNLGGGRHNVEVEVRVQPVSGEERTDNLFLAKNL